MALIVPSRPPEADGEAELQGAHVMPVPDGDEQHVSRPQHALGVRSPGEPREALRVRVLHLHLQGGSRE